MYVYIKFLLKLNQNSSRYKYHRNTIRKLITRIKNNYLRNYFHKN